MLLLQTHCLNDASEAERVTVFSIYATVVFVLLGGLIDLTKAYCQTWIGGNRWTVSFLKYKAGMEEHNVKLQVLSRCDFPSPFKLFPEPR